MAKPETEPEARAEAGTGSGTRAGIRAGSGARGSIRLRLIASGAATIVLALGAAGIGLELLFARHVERRAIAELQNDLRQLMAGFVVAPDGALTLGGAVSDPRFDRPFSGAYWQVSQAGAPVARSRSLWDEALILPPDALTGEGYHVHQIEGPRSQRLLAVERVVSVRRGAEARMYRVSAAIDRQEILGAVSDFRADLALALSALGLLFLTAFAAAIQIGLRPLERVRRALRDLRAGRNPRLSGDFPREVTPLVDDLNRLLDARDDSLARAQARAADLAHGLKTPLAAIAVLAEDLRATGDGRIGAELSGYAAAMTGHVERELARARIAGAALGAAPLSLVAALDPLIRTMKRLPGGAERIWRVAVDPAIAVRAEESALAEILGGVLDNARKWARARVEITARAEGGSVVLRICDDGPGVPADARDVVLQRGRRLDASVPGSGFGLPIAHEIVVQTGGRMTLGDAPGGGLAVEIELPAAAPAAAAPGLAIDGPAAAPLPD